MTVKDLMILKKIILADFYVVEGERFGSLGEVAREKADFELVGIIPTKGNGVQLELNAPVVQDMGDLVDFLMGGIGAEEIATGAIEEEKMVTYKSAKDGWFRFYYCSGCGHRELHMPRKTCPHCGEPITNAIDLAPGPERAAREEEEQC